MTRTFILRLLGVFGLALGLSLAITAGSASAQIAMGGPYGPTGENSSQSQIQTRPDGAFQAPYSQVQAQAGVTLPGSRIRNVGPSTPGSQIQGALQAGGATTQGDVSAAACGFYVDRADHHYAKYAHCGSAWNIKIRVNFWYGWSSRDIEVGRGVTNLSTHPSLQGAGMITNAWCVQNCW